jgi:nicotinate-nucleotide adenylyltransferase
MLAILSQVQYLTPRRVGLLGGSFSPAHAGHRHISLEALRRLQLDQVWWLISPQNPLKSADGTMPQGFRLAHACNISRHPRIIPCLLESLLGTQYTTDTLSALQLRFPCTKFVWLMGADNLIQLPRWRKWECLFRLMPIAIFARSVYSLKGLHSLAAKRFARWRKSERQGSILARKRPPAWIFFLSRSHPASSTTLRQIYRAYRQLCLLKTELK